MCFEIRCALVYVIRALCLIGITVDVICFKSVCFFFFFFFQAEDGIRDDLVTGVQTCALPILWWFIQEVSVTIRKN